MQQIKVSESTAARRRIPFYLVDDTDGKTPETGVTISAGDLKLSENGAAQANHAGTWTEVAQGLYYYEATSGEVDTVGFLNLILTKSGIRTFSALVQVVSFDPYSTTVTVGSISAGVITAASIADGALTAAKFAEDGTAQAGGASTITLAAGSSSTDDIYNGQIITIVSGTGVGQCRYIEDYVGSTKVATIRPAWVTNPDNTSKYAIGSFVDAFRSVLVESQGSITAQAALSVILSALAGEWTAAGTFKSPNGGATRISGTAASSAPFRSSITLTPSS